MIRNLVKKITAGALALLMLGTALPAGSDFTGLFSSSIMSASAEQLIAGGSCGAEVKWTLYDTDDDGYGDKLVISGKGNMSNFKNGEATHSSTAPWDEYKDTIRSVEIGEGVKTIGEHAFYYSKINKVSIPASLEYINKYAFYYSESLSELNIANGSKLNYIDDYAFRYCRNLRELYLPEGMAMIEKYAFGGNFNLKTVVLPSTMLSIGSYAFHESKSIDDVYFLNSNPHPALWVSDGDQSANSFKENKGTVCHVPIDRKADYEEYLGFLNLTFVDDLGGKCGDNALWLFTDSDNDGTRDKLSIIGKGDMYDYSIIGVDNKPPWYYYDREKIKTVEIADGITRIGKVAFLGCSSFTSVTIPASVTSIGEYAFAACSSLKTLTFAEDSKLTTIENNAFGGCTSLTSVIIPDGVTSISDYAFSFCNSLTSVTIPEGVTSIGNYAFGVTAIGSVTIPASVTSIGKDAFIYCDNCTDVYLNVTDPNALTWTDGNFDDFIYDVDNPDTHKVTKCHVPKGTLAAYREKFDDTVNVTFVTGPGNITVKKATSGKVTADKAVADMDETVTLTVTADKGYKLKSLTVKDSANKAVTVRGNKFTMPDLDVTVSAEFVPITYTIAYNLNGGTNPTDAPTSYTIESAVTLPTPTRTGYSFGGWFTKSDLSDNKVTTIAKGSTGKKTYYAKWTANTYTIKFVNEDGTLLYSSSVAYGETPEYKGATPTKAKTAQYTYKFKEWSPAIEKVTGNKTYTATYTKSTNKYTIKFVNDDGTLLYSGSVAYGSTPEYKGETPTKAKTAQYTFKFKEWSPAIEKVTGNKTYTATYTKSTNKYTIKFVNDDGTVLYSSSVAYGSTPEYKGDTPTKAKTAQYTFKFKEWSPAIEKVTGAKTYTATYTRSTNKYTIKFVNEDGTLLYSSSVAYGEMPECKGETPTKASTEVFEYTFKGWDKTVTKVTKNATYKAVFDSKRIGLEIHRLSGKNRFLTAVEISKESFEKADTVVLAFGQKYADALAGVPLAYQLNAPILLTGTEYLDSATLEEITRLGAKKVVILGGKGSISEEIDEKLIENGLQTERISGKSRYGTATAIAEKLNPNPTEVFFVFSQNYADALSVSTVAAIKNAPIIYLDKTGNLHEDTAKYLAELKAKKCVKNAYVIGGSGVISDEMMSKAVAALGLKSATRISGKDRFQTCVKVNTTFAEILNGKAICVATGKNFPDALAGGVFAAKNSAPLFLAADGLSEQQSEYLKAKAAETLYVFGGSGVVSNELVQAISKASL